MPILSVELPEILLTNVREVVEGRYASVDWFVERTLLDKVSAERTERAAPPRLRATAHRIAGAIVLTADLRAAYPVLDASGQPSPDGALNVQELFLKETMRVVPDSDSETVLGNAMLKILAESRRDTAGLGADAVEAGRKLLRKTVGASSELALWKATDRVQLELESVLDIAGETTPSRVTFSPLTKPSQHSWLGTALIPDLVVKMVRPKQLGQALRRSFAFCDMDA
jgi:hypothetical protein